MTNNFITLMMRRFSIFTIALVFAAFGTTIFAQSELPERPTAVQFLTNREAQTEWNSRSLLKGDFDYDGVTDYALAGKRDGKFVVGIVKGTLKHDSKHWTLEFAEDSASQDALCSVADARVSLENFSSGNEIAELKNLSKKSRGINLSDDKCDAFHIYYSREKEQFVWQRN
jgi:hypothetical protein